MKLNKLILVGASVAAAGVLLLGGAYATSGVVHAGNQGQCGDPDPESGIQQRPEFIAAAQSRPTCTPVTRKPRTHTPTSTSTEAPRTATPVPPTQVPPTKAPSSGNEGASVKPPNTGTGGSATSDVSVWLMVLGAMSLVSGGGAILAGVRRR